MALTTNGGRSDGTPFAVPRHHAVVLASTCTPNRATRARGSSRRSRRDPRTEPLGRRRRARSGTTAAGTRRRRACDWTSVRDLGDSAAGVAHSTGPRGQRGDDLRRLVRLGATSTALFEAASTRTTAAPGTGSTAPEPAEPLRPGLTVDPSNAAHVYAVYSGYSRTGSRAGPGHVFESYDGGPRGRTSRGNLPDVPGDDARADPRRQARPRHGPRRLHRRRSRRRGQVACWARPGGVCRTPRWSTSGCRRSGGRCSWPRTGAGSGSWR